MEPVTQLYDVKDAAQMLAVSPGRFGPTSATGKLQPIRIGRLVRLEGQELERFIA